MTSGDTGCWRSRRRCFACRGVGVAASPVTAGHPGSGSRGPPNSSFDDSIASRSYCPAHVKVRIYNQAYIEYKRVLANILRSLFVARTPSEEARSPGRRSNVENAPRRRPFTGEPATPTSRIRRAILRTAPVTRQSAASSVRRPSPPGRSHYVVISRDGRKLVTRVRVMLP